MKPEELKKIINRVITGLCKQKNNVEIGMAELNHSVSYSILVDSQDQAKVVGARGANINAIKNLFEGVEVTDPVDYKLKKVRVFLDSPQGERSKLEKFERNPNWSGDEYVELAEDLVALYVDAKISHSTMGGITFFECELLEDFSSQLRDDVSLLVSAIGKCNGGTIELTYV